MALLAKASPFRTPSRCLSTSRLFLKDKSKDREMYEKMRLKYEAQKLGLGAQGAINPLTGRPTTRSRGVSIKFDDMRKENQILFSFQDEPWFHLPVVLGSLGAFLLYFAILRFLSANVIPC